MIYTIYIYIFGGKCIEIKSIMALSLSFAHYVGRISAMAMAMAKYLGQARMAAAAGKQTGKVSSETKDGAKR